MSTSKTGRENKTCFISSQIQVSGWLFGDRLNALGREMCNKVGIYFTENWLDSELDSLQNAVQTNTSISIELVAAYAAFVSQIALELGSTLK